MDTSVPGQQDDSDAALVDMLMLEAPVGLALFGSDLRFRWVNAALTRLNGQAGADPSGWTGQLPSEAWPEHVAVRAEAALHKVLDEGVPLAERGYPVVSPPPGRPADPAVPAAEDVCGCASWFPVHDAAGKVFGVGLIMLNVAGLRAPRPPRRPRPRSGAARSGTVRWSRAAPRWSGWRRRTAR